MAYFIIENSDLRHPILALYKLKEEYTRENILEVIIDIVKDYCQYTINTCYIA